MSDIVLVATSSGLIGSETVKFLSNTTCRSSASTMICGLSFLVRKPPLAGTGYKGITRSTPTAREFCNEDL